MVMVYALLAAGALGLGLLYLLFAPGPRRTRAFRRAEKLLADGAADAALAVVEQLQPARQPAAWRQRLAQLAGEAHQHKVELLLKERQFDRALHHATAAAALLQQDADDARKRVVEAALAEVRRLFAAGPGEQEAMLAMIAHTATLAGLQPPEATFWQALSLVRQGQMEPALLLLGRVNGEVGKQILDVPLYLGIVLHRVGRPQEALRHLGEANRIDSTCALLSWQMGVSLVASGGDSGLAVRALQRALGNRGLAAWQGQQERFWAESFPEGKSYIRRLASRHPFRCPLLGDDPAVLVRQGQLALAQALYRQDRYQEAAELYARLLQNSPPTPRLLRGYGLALARLGQFDQAYKHLRIAHEEEAPKDAFTAAYLALCGALGKPINAEDKPRNITWAIQRLARFPVANDREWAGIVSQIHAEARSHGVGVGVDDQLLLCDTLAAVEACDPSAAEAYAHLARTFPDAVRPLHAWLYGRAAAEGSIAEANLDLLGQVFLQTGAARAYFEQRGWDFAELEYVYLARCASQAPGHFPASLGRDYAGRGETFLLTRVRRHEEAGHKDRARESAEVLLALAPASPVAHDQLARLHYQTGNVDRAVELLHGWQQLAPTDHWPHIRRAVIESQRGNTDRRAEAITRALGLTHGPTRAAVAFLGARLTLGDAPGRPEALAPSRRLLEECLHDHPDHVEALWCLAALHASCGDQAALAGLAPRLDRPEVDDARFHFLGAVAHLAANQYHRVEELASRVADSALQADCCFVRARARLHPGDADGAIRLLRQALESPASPSHDLARALLGQLCLSRSDLDEAIAAWSAIDPPQRKQLGLDDPLRQAVYLAGLRCLDDARFEQAAERFREAGKLGLRESRLGSLIHLALVKAAQRLLFEESAGG